MAWPLTARTDRATGAVGGVSESSEGVERAQSERAAHKHLRSVRCNPRRPLRGLEIRSCSVTPLNIAVVVPVAILARPNIHAFR